MKKWFFLLVAVDITCHLTAQCVIDPNSSGFISPRPDSLPCVERGILYDQTIQFSIPASINLGDFIPNLPFPYTLFIDSIVIYGVNGLPSGLNYTSNPADGTIRGGQRGCAQINGTTYDPAGNYPITFDGYMKVRGLPLPGIFDGDTTFDFSGMQGMGQQGFTLSLEVIEPGDPCRELSAILASSPAPAVTVYPNPAYDQIQIKIEAVNTPLMRLHITDMAGRMIWQRSYKLDRADNIFVEVASWPSGCYLLHTTTPTSNTVQNLLIY